MNKIRKRSLIFESSVEPSGYWKAWLLAGFLGVMTIGLAALVVLGVLPPGPRVGMLALTLFMLLLTLVLGVGAAMSVNRLRYELSPQGLQIWFGRWRGPLLPRSEIRGVLQPHDVRPHLWTSMAGIRMSGLYVANINNPSYGNVALFVTTRDSHLILLDTRTQRYGLSPADPKAFIEALNRWGVPEQDSKAAGVFRPAPGGPVGLGATDRWLFILSAAVTVAAGIWVFSRLPVLPDRVPVHFDAAGQADRYGSPLELVGISLFLLGSNLFGGVGLLWFFARSNDPLTARILALLSLAGALMIGVMAVAMTWV